MRLVLARHEVMPQADQLQQKDALIAQQQKLIEEKDSQLAEKDKLLQGRAQVNLALLGRWWGMQGWFGWGTGVRGRSSTYPHPPCFADAVGGLLSSAYLACSSSVPGAP